MNHVHKESATSQSFLLLHEEQLHVFFPLNIYNAAKRCKPEDCKGLRMSWPSAICLQGGSWVCPKLVSRGITSVDGKDNTGGGASSVASGSMIITGNTPLP